MLRQYRPSRGRPICCSPLFALLNVHTTGDILSASTLLLILMKVIIIDFRGKISSAPQIPCSQYLILDTRPRPTFSANTTAMTATRHNGGAVSNTRISSVPPRPTKRKKVTGGYTQANISKHIRDQPSVSQIRSRVTNTSAAPWPSSELSEATLTPTAMGKTPQKRSPTKQHQPLREPAGLSIYPTAMTMQLSVAAGSSHDPIILTEDSPRAKDRVQFTRMEPVNFHDKNNMPYMNRAPRATTRSMTTFGASSVGQWGSDMHRIHAEMMEVQAQHTNWNQHVQPDIPCAHRHPENTRDLSLWSGIAAPSTTSALQYLNPPLRPYPCRTETQPLSEDQLRRKASQYRQEWWRPSSRTERTPRLPNNASASDSGSAEQDHLPTTKQLSLAQGPRGSHTLEDNVHATLLDPHYQLAPIIDQTLLLASLLHVYHHSTDQAGLREDIAMLASTQSQYLAGWLEFEAERSGNTAVLRGRHRLGRMAMTSPVYPVAFCRNVEAENEKRIARDEQIRGLLSARAELWQDGSGMGVADV